MHAAESTETLFLPPLFRGVRLEEGRVPFASARARAAADGAGTLYHAEAPGSLAFAVVLEPEVPLAEARGVFPVAVAAVADALSALCPPERSVAIGWPDRLVYDRAQIGGARLAWPEGAREDAVPDWLVFAADIIRDRDDIDEPGLYPDSISLAEEDFGPPSGVVESFARHMMLHMDTWRTRGHGRAVAGYLERLAAPEAGRARLEATGDLVIETPAGAARHGLVAALAASDWFDPERGGPRL
jgi:hypothetical protein